MDAMDTNQLIKITEGLLTPEHDEAAVEALWVTKLNSVESIPSPLVIVTAKDMRHTYQGGVRQLMGYTEEGEVMYILTLIKMENKKSNKMLIVDMVGVGIQSRKRM